MTEAAPAPTQAGEIEFGFDELFFSRTNPAGIIEYGNSVFQRLSGYSWQELDGAPHKIIRHSDMPRAVFWLLWDTIKQGLPIGAYVKNRAKDGRHYWVFAIVTPVEDGYLSVRLRPSSPIFSTVKNEYQTLIRAEKSDQLTPADSARVLLSRLAELGFADYRDFMAAALKHELAACDQHLQRPTDTMLQRFGELTTAAESLLGQSSVISQAYLSNENIPFNFRVLAAQLGREGGAIDVISTNYSLLSNEMQGVLERFTASAQNVFRTINDGCFLAATARVQRELLDFFKDEDDLDGLSRDQEMLLLDKQQVEYRKRASAGLQAILNNVEGFQRACLEMNRLAAGLEVTRVMGKVECARHTDFKERLDELLRELDTFQKTVAVALREIDHMNRAIRQETSALLTDASAAA